MEISVENLNASLDRVEILRQVSMSVKNKEFVGIIGPNGSGKSTLLQCIYRVLTPDSGAIYLDGSDLQKLSIRQSAQKQAVLAQHNYCNFDFSVLDVVLMGRSPYKKIMERNTSEDYRIARQCLDTVGLGHYERQDFAALSGGEQQRVMLARALAQSTPCLIMDEPTNHLDVKYQLQLLSTVKRMRLTIVAAIHDLNLAAMYCDRLIAMNDGRIVRTGTPEEVLTEKFIEQLYEVRPKILRLDNGRIVIAYQMES